MANTSLTLGSHWEAFIRNEVASGRYNSASEVVRDALRELEERQVKMEALRAHLGMGECQARAGEVVDDFSMDELIRKLDRDGRDVPDNTTR
ncbi:type II toxin-antitoxin system ParD family antitoxin [Aquisalimonas sp. APHAB1-3]|uniref:type II toxin-antitoxin system ParD family antitoxin n=1 Tax=Aquisalimonas sp. APHAB1-3 TaxID=3402080 RepID=UPI003AADB2DD